MNSFSPFKLDLGGSEEGKEQRETSYIRMEDNVGVRFQDALTCVCSSPGH